MDTCKSDLINHLEFQENLSLYVINELHHGECFCTIFTYALVCVHKSHSLAKPRSLVLWKQTSA